MRKLISVVLCEIILCVPVVFAQEGAQVPPENGVAPESVSAAKTDAAPAEQATQAQETQRVVFNPKTKRDPTLSPADVAELARRDKLRRAKEEAERLRLEEERRRRAEEEERERLRQLALQKDPAREVRNKIKIGGIIDKEVFIGTKIYTVGNTIYGARIVEVRPEEVVFSYKGHTFIKRIPL